MILVINLILLILTTAVVSKRIGMDKDVIQDLMTPLMELGEGCGYQGCPEIGKDEEDHLIVHIVPHTHGELGESNTFQEYYTGADKDGNVDINFKKILDFVVTQLWEDRRRKITLYDLPYFFQWWLNRDDTVHRMVLELVRQGRLHVVGGGWGMPDAATTSYHALIDSFTHGLRKLNKTLGPCARPLVAWQADVYGHSREFAALTAMMGFDGLFINPISFEDEVYRMTRKELEMVWRGSDDLGSTTDLFTHKLFDGYWAPPGFCFSSRCNDSLLVTSDTMFTNELQRASDFIHSVKNRQGPNYQTNHVMVVMGKRMGYYDANMWFKNIDALILKVNQKSIIAGDKVKLVYSAPACYLKAVHDKGITLPIKQDDFMSISYDKLIHFTGHFTSRPTIKFMAREAHVHLQIVKQLHVLAKLHPKNINLYKDLIWITGVFQDHKIITGAMTPVVKDYYTHKMYIAMQKSSSLVRMAFNKIRESPSVVYYRCAFNVSSCRNTYSLRSFVVIYNPLAWPVTVPVRIPVIRRSTYLVYNPKLAIVKSVLMKISTAVMRLHHRVAKAVYEIVFMAEKLPPMGFRSYYIESSLVTRKKLKRSIIKKLRNNKKKYFARQTDALKIDDKSMLDAFETGPLDYGDDLDVGDDSYDEPLETTTSASSNTSIITVLDTSTQILFAPNTTTQTPSAPNTTTQTHSAPNTTTRTPSSPNAGVDAEDELDLPLLNVRQDISHKWQPDYRISTTTEILTMAKMKPTRWRPKSGRVFSDEKAEFFENRKFFDTLPLQRDNVSTTEPPSTTSITTEYYDAMNDPQLNLRRNFYSKKSQDKFIRNRYIKVNLDSKNQVARIKLSNGVQVALTIALFYYVSDDPVRLQNGKRTEPGPTVFNPMDPTPEPIHEHLYTEVHKTYIVEEVQYSVASWAGFVVRVYVDRPLVELDWVVGPIPIENDLGKDIFIRYSTDLDNGGVFYTDSNGRQTIKRIRNRRASYDAVLANIPSNFYPVTSKIYIEDLKKNIRFSVFNDRSQGGTSLKDGQIDMMLHRRILTNEGHGFQFLNDSEFGNGIMVRGKHYLYFSKADYKLNKIFEKKFAKEVELAPQIFAGPSNRHGSKLQGIWRKHKNEFHGVVKKLPVGVHVLTLQEWNDGTLLLRLENYLELSDVIKGGERTVFIKDLFANITIINVRETTLGGNIWLDDYLPMQWYARDLFVKNFNDFYGGNGKEEYSRDRYGEPEPANITQGIKLLPQQIRTFVVTYYESK